MEENDFIRLTNTVYRVLDFFPDGDPLKYKAKEKALAIVEHLTLISATNGWMSLKKEMAVAQVLNDIEVLKHYLSIGKNQGWLDNINFLIITKEYNTIENEIKPLGGVVGQNLIVESSPLARLGSGVKTGTVERDKEIVDTKKLLANKNNQEVGGAPVVEQNSLRGKEYSQRQKKILQILATREKAQVSDLIKELPNVTKRTVRRDLDDLLKRDKIVRVGEWNQVFYILGREEKS